MDQPINIGTVVGNTSPQEFRFNLKRMSAQLGDLVNVEIDIPADQSGSNKLSKQKVLVWGRITELLRYNPFLPAEVGAELADEGLNLIDTVLSNSKDQIEGKVLVLGRTSLSDLTKLLPLSYPVQPGAVVRLPPADAVKTILIGDAKKVHRIRIGSLIGRREVDVSIKSNALVARHMAILAMTGGGKTVASRRIIKELLNANYPLLILDPHGDYLGFWEKKELFPNNQIKLFYPYLNVTENNRDLISFLVREMTQGFTEPQKDVFGKALESIKINENEAIEVSQFIERLLQELTSNKQDYKVRSSGTIPAVRRGLRFVKKQMVAMQASNEALRFRLKDFPFEKMPDPISAPDKFIAPGRASIVYLGGYDHLTQSTIVALILKNLFEVRASMRNTIPPFLAVIEEAHNFIPSRGEGQSDTPSVEIIRKVITEGRKFGTGLLLISQRPSRLDETTLSQCNTFLIFRLVNPRDQSFVEKVMENLTKSDSRLLPGFGPGQGIVSGQAVRFPLIVQVDYDADLVSTRLGDEDFVLAVKNWHSSPEGLAAEVSQKIDDQLNEAEQEYNNNQD